jgi:cyclase
VTIEELAPAVRAQGRVEEVADGVFAYVQPDGGWCLNNAGIIVSGGECALVDTAATESRALGLKQAAAQLCPAPPRIVVNTHFHGDHCFGNYLFAPEAVVVAHELCRAEMAEAGLQLTGLWPDVQWGAISLALPTLTFRDRLTLHIGDIEARLLHFGPAHTTNDAVVWIPDRRVLFTGDLIMSGVTPFVPMGSLSGSLETIDRLRDLGPAVIVPGHGPVGGPELLDDVEGYLRRVLWLAAEGHAVGDSVLDLARTADFVEYAHWLDPERLVPNLRRAYAELDGAAPGDRLDMALVFGEMVQFHGGLPVCHA